MKKGVITIAIGEEYVRLASNLAYSFLCFNSTSDIGFTIISNKDVDLDQRLVEGGVTVITSNALAYTQNSILLNKFIAPGLSPFENTMMLDADCMIAGSLSPLFEMLHGVDFALVGEQVSKGYWHIDVSLVLRKFRIPAIYKFVGSFYFFSNKEVVRQVYAKASEIAASPDGLPIDKIHHGLINEEVPLSIAIATLEENMHFKVLPESSPIKAETMYYQRRRINLLSGVSRVSACSSKFRNEVLGTDWPVSKMALIVAFDSDSRRHLDYKMNALLMRLWAPLRMRKRASSNILKPNYAVKVVLVISLSIFLDLYNTYVEIKQFVRRILNDI